MIPPSGRGTAIMAWFSMYSCSWWPTRYSPSMTSSACSRPAVEVALGQREVGELLLRLARIEDGRQGFGAQRDVPFRLAQRGPIGCRQQRDRLGVMADLRLDQHRLVVGDEADEVVAGDVGSGQDDHLRPIKVRVQLEPEQPGMRLGRADRVAVPGAGKDEIVGVHAPCRSAWPGPRAATAWRAPARDRSRHWPARAPEPARRAPARPQSAVGESSPSWTAMVPALTVGFRSTQGANFRNEGAARSSCDCQRRLQG